MEDIHSYNSRAAPGIKQLLVPSPAQIFLNLIIGILILALLNIKGIWQFFTTGVTADSTIDFGSLINDRLPWVTGFIYNLTHGRIIQVLFWLFVGCIVYMMIWFLGNFFTNIRNDIVADEYVHPQFYNRVGYWGSVFARKIFFISIVMVLIAYIYAGLKLIASLAALSYQSISIFQLPMSMVVLAGSIMGVAIAIQVFQVLFKISKNSWQVIYKDL